jgi:arylformamidase
MTWIDVSLPMRPTTVHWPGHPRYTIDELYAIGRGDEMNVTAVSLCSHFGTHIDAPSHYVEAGSTIDMLPIDLLIGRCTVVHYRAQTHIPADFVDALDLDGVRRLLIRTPNSDSIDRPEFREDYTALTPAAAERLVARGIELLGVDGYSIGPFDPALGVPVHRIFLGGGPSQVALEALSLAGVDAGEYHLIALPPAFADIEAAPARVLLRPATQPEV